MARPATGIVKEKLNITLSRSAKTEITKIAQYNSMSVSALVEQWTNDYLEERKRSADNRERLKACKEANGIYFSVLVGVSNQEQIEKIRKAAAAAGKSPENLIQDIFRQHEENFIAYCLDQALSENE